MGKIWRTRGGHNRRRVEIDPRGQVVPQTQKTLERSMKLCLDPPNSLRRSEGSFARRYSQGKGCIPELLRQGKDCKKGIPDMARGKSVVETPKKKLRTRVFANVTNVGKVTIVPGSRVRCACERCSRSLT